jgi:hypothetical protein
MKALNILFILGLQAAQLAYGQVTPQVAVFKRLETITSKNESEQTTPQAGQATLSSKFTDESWEILDLTGDQNVVIQVYPTLKKYEIKATVPGILYTKMQQKLAGSFLWYRAEGQSVQAEFLSPITSAIELGYDYFPDATATTPSGDGVADYFSTYHVVRNDSGKAAPLVVKTGLVSATLNVPKSITISGAICEQNEDTEALGKTGKGDRGMSAITLSGTVALDLALTTRANTVTAPGQTLGTLAYGVELVKQALEKRGLTSL